MLVDDGGVDDPGVDELSDPKKELVRKKGTRKAARKTNLEDPKIAFERVAEEDRVVVDHLGELGLDVAQARRDVLELLRC